MATDELEDQPTMAVENKCDERTSEFPVPDTKSGVRVDPDAFMTAPSTKFLPGDTVHMSESVKGARVKGTYRVYKAQYNRNGQFTEYQLMGRDTKALHNNGSWYREKELRIDKRG